MRRPTLAFASSLALAALAAVVTVRPRVALAADDFPVPPPLKEPPPTGFECRFTELPVTVDGNLSEAAWTQAQVIDAFHLPWLGDKARMARTATKARLLWDREYLYFAADMEDGDLFADVKEHDGKTWDNDVFELFFRPDATKPGYYEFQVNAANTPFDCFFPKRDFANFEQQKKAHKFHIQSKVALRGTLNKREDKDEGWTVEGRIPWTDFNPTGGRPEPGEAWKFTLCRYDYNQAWPKPELSTVAPIAKPVVSSFFHQSEDYAALKFVFPDNKSAVTPYGLTDRPPLTESTVVGFPDPPTPYRITRAYPDFKPAFPIMVRHVPGTDQMLLIAQPKSSGPTTISRFTDDPKVTAKGVTKVMDTPDDGIAYDIAFHPKFAENGYLYVGWSQTRRKKPWTTQVTRYTMARTAPYAVDPASAKLVIEWPSNGHNGGACCFGNDGMLYVTTGDGTSDSDTDLTGQRPDLLLAKLLRLDVDHPAEGKAYSIPKDNPYVADKRFVPETWAYGFRNPWRIASDPKTGHIWVGQNGQDLWEQAMLIEKGANYGWSVTEGGHPFYPNRTPGPTPIVKPTIDHSHAEFRSLTGGFVYHGEKLPGLKGAYVYGDYSTGRVWGMKHDGKKSEWHKELAITPMKITAFAPDSKGELLICDHDKEGVGGFYTLEPTPPAPPSTFPRTLAASGLFDAVKSHKVKTGVVPYSINAPFWSDGMYKERFIALPPGGGFAPTGGRGWNFPDKTVIVKSFALPGGDAANRKWIETRFLTKQGGEWYGYSYQWNDAGTDATLVDAKGADQVFAVGGKKQTWHYPSRAECMVCHSRAANYVLGLTEGQMYKDHDYGGCVDNQYRVFERLGMLQFDSKFRNGAANEGQRQAPAKTTLNPTPREKAKPMPDPADKAADLTARAKSWLHSNCSNCHVEAGGGNAAMELGFNTELTKMRIMDVKPLHATFDIPDARIVAPGDPDRSVLIKRVSTRGTGQMPPLASHVVDDAGVSLLREWVKSLKKE